MSRLEVFVLGPLLVQCDGRPVELGPLRRRATLAALLVDPDRIVALDTVLDRVWDGEPPDSAVTAAQAYVSRLRSALTRAGAGEGAASPIVTEHPGYRLAVAPDAVDAVRFAAAVTAARAARDAGDPATAARTVRAGLALWRGDAYADVPTRVARAEAERLAGLRASARQLAVECDLACGRAGDVLDELRELIGTSPLSEPLHRLLMLALHRSGRPAEALDHFARVRALLADELGVDPGRDLQDLHARMLRDDPGLVPGPPPAVVVPPPPPGPVATAPASLDTTADAPRLIGRVPEAATVRDALDHAFTRGFRAVAVVGEAGIGKTRLLEEGATHARGAGAAVAWGRSWQHDGAPRMWPFEQVLRTLAAEFDPSAFAAAVEPYAAALAALVPDLVTAPAVAPAAVPDVARSELVLVDAVAQVLTRLGRARPLLVVLEDLHWADPASRRTTEYLVTHLHDAGVALALSVRWPSDEATVSTGALLAGIARGPGVTRIDLAGFDAADVGAYVTDRTGAVLDAATTAALVERTDGNPFFVGEIVRLVVTDSGLTAADAGAARVPDSVRAVVLARLDRLPAEDRAVLDAAAVVGRSFDLDLLVAASGAGEDVVDEAVDRATAAGVVATEPGHPGTHRFGHALVQQTLLESLGPSRRRRVHARVAAELARREVAPGVPRDPDHLVHHLAGAGGDTELAAAVDLCVRRADAARHRADFAAAEDLLLQGLDLAARLRGPGAPRAELATRLRLYALYNLLTPSGDAARPHRERATELVRAYGSADDLLVAAQAAFAEGVIRMDVAGMEVAVTGLDVAAAATDDDTLRLGAAQCRTQLLFYVGRIADSLAAAEVTIELLDRGVRVNAAAYAIHPARAARWFRAAALSMLARDDEALDQLAALDEVGVGDDPLTTTYVGVLVALLHALRGEPEAAVVAVERCQAARADADITDGALYVDAVAAWTAGRARPATGPGAIAAALAPYDAMPSLGLRPFLRGLQADLALLAGDVDGAVTAVARGLDEIDRTGERWSEPWLARLGAVAAARAGDAGLAGRWRERSCAAAAAIGIPVAPTDTGWRFLTPAHLAPVER